MSQALAEQLLGMQARDLELREQLMKEERLFGEYADEMQAVHDSNAHELAAIIAQYGWPGPDLVGLEAARAAWLVAQHAIGTPALQRGFRDCLQAAGRLCGLSPTGSTLGPEGRLAH